MGDMCLFPSCGGVIYARGLCRACYHIARRLVRQGRTTWEELEKAGKAVRKLSKRPYDHDNATIRWFLDKEE